MSLRILAVTSEAYPLAKTGGLGDAIGGMARALHASGTAITIMLPAYRGTIEHLTQVREIARLRRLPGGEARLLHGLCPALGNVPVLLLHNDKLYDRDHLYVDADGREYEDNAIRYAALSHAAVRVASGATKLPKPDVVHAHDWHTGLVPLLLRDKGVSNVRTILTLHNMAFQGVFPMETAAAIGVDERYLDVDGIEYWGKLSFMKAGIRYADRITTVSQTYAREILTERFGCGLEGVLATRLHDLLAVPNGIDPEEWDPATDVHLGKFQFSTGDMSNKRRCKQLLQRHFGLMENPRAPVLVMGSRLTHQKMADVAVQALPRVLDDYPDLQVAVLGQGEKPIEAALRQLQRCYPGRCAVRIGFDEATAHMLHAGGDLLLHGSRFEPFGLTPLYAMRYGTIPIGSRVGGMADTITDPGAHAGRDAMRNATGLLFEGDSVDAMAGAITRAMGLYRRPPIWQAMQYRAMTSDFGWDRAVLGYVSLYRSLLPDEALQDVAVASPAASRPSLLDQVTAAARPLAVGIGVRAAKESAPGGLRAGAA
ncbi:glycogen synthase GlgA [Bordetella genomosp. 9]|uniref:Glycogen synthase n=1 Tax=Bordetella genomosp. 9 TaxID=1416803 RepID=A0A1W6YZY9_9BORD|nr:glycogen synthase GlgA [Bordetella genomosp. 9]ARP86439.1 starch synthase [Bordetella genomosp. 9]ARP90456.1 starch synthase [Bordetella genomosp. 9]